MNNTASIILATEKSNTSKKPYAAWEVLFKPCISWVVDALTKADVKKNAVLSSYRGEFADILPRGFAEITDITEYLSKNINYDVILLKGNMPLINCEIISNSLKFHRENGNDLTRISAEGCGRTEIFWAKSEFLIKALEKSRCENPLEIPFDCCKSEVYMAKNPQILSVADSRKALAEINEAARLDIIDKHYENGVNIPFPKGVIISSEVEIGRDTTIMPNCIITGDTVIGEDCIIGEGTNIVSSKIGKGNSIVNSLIENSIIHNNAHIGPYVHIRPKSEIFDNVKLGNFVEIKSSSIGENTSVAHLTYLGDSDVGRYVNVGCGVVTANYDGEKKYKTVIGDSSFIGCNTNFIAPVTLGRGVITAAGSTITEDAGDFDLAIARNRQTNLEGWAAEKGKYKKGLDVK